MLLCGQSDVFSGSGGGGAENNSSYRFNCVDRDTKAELLPREDSTFKDSGLSQSRLLSVPEGRSGVVRSAGNSVDHSFVDGQRPSDGQLLIHYISYNRWVNEKLFSGSCRFIANKWH